MKPWRGWSYYRMHSVNELKMKFNLEQTEVDLYGTQDSPNSIQKGTATNKLTDIQCPPELMAPFSKIEQTRCYKIYLSFILMIFHSKYTQKSNL